MMISPISKVPNLIYNVIWGSQLTYLGPSPSSARMKFAPSLAALVMGAAFLNDVLPRVYAADQHPSQTVTYFENLPQRLYYFDDTTVNK